MEFQEVIKDNYDRIKGFDLEGNSFCLYNTDNKELNQFLTMAQRLLNKHFENMNSRAKTKRYFKAQDSRQLLEIFKALEYFEQGCNDFCVKYKLDDNYSNHIAFCKTFLQYSNGSEIPEDYKEFTTQKYKAIFNIGLTAFSEVKLLVFGAEKTKPDIVIKDVLDGKIDVVNDTDLLVYDGEIVDSLIYKDFNKWWGTVSKEKYINYKSSLNEIETKIVEYYKVHYKRDDFPVLIPQVYLHYDPKNQKQRQMIGEGKILNFQRMDFLIIYKGKRIVIEIDGQTHTPENSLEKYSAQCKYDRDMRFLGYEVFRLGGYELTHNFENVVKDFFENLFHFLNLT